MLLLSVIFALTACGGGSGGSDDVASSDDQQSEQTNDGDELIADDADSNDQNGNDQNGNDQNGNDQNGNDQNGNDQNSGDVQGDESAQDLSSVEAPDGSIIRMVGGGDVTAQEGSTVVLSFTLENIDNAAVSSPSIAWQRIDENSFNTRVPQGEVVDQTFSVLLPLVDENSVLEYQASVSFRLLDDVVMTTERVTLQIPFQINVTDGLASEGQVIAALGRPAPGITGASISSIDHYDYSKDGKVVIAGSYRTDGGEQGHAIWSGTPDSLALVIKTGDAIPGLPSNATFDEVDSLSIASGGEYAALVKLQGAGTSRAALVSEGGVVRSILRNGDLFPSSIFPGQVGSIRSITRTTNGAYISARNNSQSERGYWKWTNGSFTLVGLSFEAMNSVIPAEEADSSSFTELGLPISADGCFISILGDVEVNDEGDAAFMANIGSLRVTNLATFQSATVPSDCPRGLNLGQRLVQYQEGAAREVVGSGDFSLSGFNALLAFPGIANSGFQIEGIRDVHDDGSVLFDAEVLEDINALTRLPARADAILKSTQNGNGPVSLVALQRETLPPNFVQRLDSFSRLYTAPTEGEQIAIMTDTSDGVIVLSGQGHAGQPHTTLTAIGASALRYVSGEGASAPQGYPPTAFFTAFSLPVIDASGVVRFQATLNDSSDDTLLENGLWVSFPDGTTSLRSSTFAPVQSLGRQIRLRRTDVSVRDIVPVSGLVSPINQRLAGDSEGGLIFLGDLDDALYSANASALVYFPPNRSTVR